MLLIYDHDNILHLTSEKGLRWNRQPPASSIWGSHLAVAHAPCS